MKKSAVIVVSVVVGVVVILLLAFGKKLTGNAYKIVKSSTPAEKRIALEQSSGLQTGELFLSQRSFWNTDPKKEILFEYNAGPECKGDRCIFELEVSLAREAPFKKLAEMYDDGNSGDWTGRNGIHSARVEFNPPGYKDRKLRFRVKTKDGKYSNLVYLNVGPEITLKMVTDFLPKAAQFENELQAIDPKDKAKLEELVKKIESDPAVAKAYPSKETFSIIIRLKAGYLHRISYPLPSDLKSTPASQISKLFSTPAFARAPSTRSKAPDACGGWEGDIVAVSPYLFEFGDDDTALSMGKKLEEDKQGRFKVSYLLGPVKNSGRVSWFMDSLFQGRNGILISSHGGYGEEFPKILCDDFSDMFSELPGDRCVGSQLDINKFVDGKDGALSLRYLRNGIFVSGADGRVFLTPAFFRNMGGQMKPNSFALLSFCQSAMEPGAKGFVEAFHQRGARIIFAYDEYILGGSSWNKKTEDSIVNALLEGTPLKDVPIPPAHSYSIAKNTRILDGKETPFPLGIFSQEITVNFVKELNKEKKDSEHVAFPGGDKKEATLTMIADGKPIKLVPYGCYLHDALIASLGKVWSCKWSRTGKLDTAPFLTINFMGEKPPKKGKTYRGGPANMSYGERECSNHDSFAYPELLEINVMQWDPKIKLAEITFEGTVSNNGMIGVEGEDGLKFFKIEKGSAFIPIVDAEPEEK